MTEPSSGSKPLMSERRADASALRPGAASPAAHPGRPMQVPTWPPSWRPWNRRGGKPSRPKRAGPWRPPWSRHWQRFDPTPMAGPRSSVAPARSRTEGSQRINLLLPVIQLVGVVCAFPSRSGGATHRMPVTASSEEAAVAEPRPPDPGAAGRGCLLPRPLPAARAALNPLPEGPPRTAWERGRAQPTAPRSGCTGRTAPAVTGRRTLQRAGRECCTEQVRHCGPAAHGSASPSCPNVL